MARKIYLAPHLTTEELQQRYKVAPRAADARRYHALWLISQGQTAQAAAQIVGLSEKWVRTLVQRYNAAGPVGLCDHRTDNPGQAPLLNPAQRTALAQALATAPPEGGLWTGRKVAAWIERETGISTYPQRGWVYLRRLGLTPQTPRPRHAQAATEAEQTAWKKNSSSGSTP